MDNVTPFLLEADSSSWDLTPAKRPQGSVAFISYANKSKTSRDNPRFQMHVKLRVKHEPSPGLNKTREEMPHARCNIELGVPRGFEDIHAWFAAWDKVGIRHTHDNQEVVWPGKRAKNLDDILPEGLFRASIPDSQRLVDNGWDPALRLKAVPPGPPEKPNWKASRIYVQNSDGTVREGGIDDISRGDEIIASVEVEGWYGSKDSSGFTYRLDEGLIIKAHQRPKGLTLRALDGDGPIVKRMRQIDQPIPAAAADSVEVRVNIDDSAPIADADGNALFPAGDDGGLTDDETPADEAGF
jgi:hypothetical protein